AATDGANTMAMPAAAGPISLIADRLEITLAATAAWSSLTGATIHHNALPEKADGEPHTLDELVAQRPFARIWTTDDGIQWKRDTARGGACVSAVGELIIHIERNTPTGLESNEADRDFENLIGQICNGTAENPGLMNLAGDARYLPITRLSLLDHSRTDRSKRKSIGDAQRAFLLVQWSNE
ncbi:MAG: hypothetical protein WBD31_13350, partial [Rubripirellula sp.]